MKVICPKNWAEFQHYKDRSPAWIKLHKRLLDDFEFQMLPVASRALAPMLWLLASEYDDGEIPADTRKIAFRLRMTLEDLSLGFEPLVRRGFFEIIGEDGEDASTTLAEPERDASPEKEIQVTSKTQVETEKKRAPAAHVDRLKDPLPDWIPEDAWQAFVEMRVKIRAPLTGRAVKLAISDLQKLRDQGCDARAVLEQSVMRSWRGLFPVEVKNGQGNHGPNSNRSHERDIATERATRDALEAIRRRSGQTSTGGPGESAGRDGPKVTIIDATPTSEPRGNHRSFEVVGENLPAAQSKPSGAITTIPDFLRRPSARPVLAIGASDSAIPDQRGQQILPDTGANPGPVQVGAK